MYRLLIVDDNYYDRIGISELSEWKLMGFDEIYLAEDGEEGLAKALETERKSLRVRVSRFSPVLIHMLTSRPTII